MLTRKINSIADRITRKFARITGATAEGYPAGHYYSAIPSRESIQSDESRIWVAAPRTLPGINLREVEQLELLRRIAAYYPELPWQADGADDLRYFYENGFYCYSDVIFLHGVMRIFNPKRIIEVGSGFSSAAVLDINSRFFDNQIALTCIDPDVSRLRSLVRPNDSVEIVEKRVQEVDIELFQALGENDILFIDSTHVLKTGSDVNHLLFEVLPILRPGVLIHFHDIFYPFEYPRNWVLELRFAWNEDYALRAFLQYNETFQIRLFNTFLEEFHASWFAENMPLCLKNLGGSIWLQKVC